MSLDRQLLVFQMRWERGRIFPPKPTVPAEAVNEPKDPSKAPSEHQTLPNNNLVPNDSPDPMSTRIDEVTQFIDEIFELVDQETQEWAKNARQAQSELEHHIRSIQATRNQAAGEAGKKPNP